MLALAGPPSLSTPVPAAVRQVLEGMGLESARLKPVWANEAGGLTFSITEDDGGRAFYAKYNPAGSGESLADEAERLRWLAGRHPAPEVVAVETLGGDEVLITKALPGESAVSEQWKKAPKTALHALGVGLRELHDLPVEDCPYDWGVEQRVLADGTSAEVAREIGEPPPIDQLVVCQGDPCAPNTLIAEDGSFLAHVDLARLGVADRWADLAVMTMSLEWNFEDYDEADFWDAYGVQPDLQRIAYYRALWRSA